MRSRMVPLLPWMGLSFLLASCALLFPDRTAPKSTDYEVTPPGPPWHRLAVSADPAATESQKADLAFENPDTGAIISLNSLCRKYTDESLEALTNNLVRGIGNRQQIQSRTTQIAGVDALDTLFSGEVDKVRLQIRTVVLIKDDCTYDFIYVSVPKREAGSPHSFDSFLASFRVD